MESGEEFGFHFGEFLACGEGGQPGFERLKAFACASFGFLQ